MKILLINHYAGSVRHGMEYRPYYLAREWVKAGHEVTITAASCSHVRTTNPRTARRVTREWVDGIGYVWMRTPAYHGNGVRRVVNILSFVSQLWMDESWSRRGMFDLVIGSSTYPIDMYPAARIARKCAARLVYEVHDLWPLSLIELGGMSTRHPFVQLMQAGENYAYRTADRVVSILPKTIDHMRLHGMEASKWVYVPNGIDIGEWSGENGRFRLPDQHEKVIAGLDDEGYFKVAYTGAHGLANGLYTVLDAAEMLRGQKVAFILVGQGPEKNGLVEAAQSRKLERLYFLPPVAKDEIPGLLSRMDALYIGLKNEPLFRFGISPNKLMDYMMAAKPVIYAIQAGNNPVDESGCGISIPPGSAKELADAVVRLQSTSKEVLRKKGLSGQTYVKEHHSYNRLASKFLNEVMG